jgi:5'-methylthioadenosine phosphorylase
VIGGTGFYELLDVYESITVDTPYGPPSDTITVGAVAGRPVAFLPRHGNGHRFAPHTINYRANLWALHSLGARRVLAPCAVGSLHPTLRPGEIVVPDQVVDLTHRRVRTFFDDGAAHATFADPYCVDLRGATLKASAAVGVSVLDGGTMVIIEGPRFSSRAESQYYARQGWSLINMTGEPEATLARELGICYAPIALVTDVDSGADATEAVHQEDVQEVFASRIEVLRDLVSSTVAALEEGATCRCPQPVGIYGS